MPDVGVPDEDVPMLQLIAMPCNLLGLIVLIYNILSTLL